MNTIDFLTSSLEALGYSARTLLLGATQKSFTQFSHPERSQKLLISTESPLYPFPSASMRIVSKDKSFTYDIAKTFGVSIPETVYVDVDRANLNEAEHLLRGGKVIVKPANASLSHGLTLNITHQQDLEKAIENALLFSDKAIVQRQFEGDEIRFVVADGEVRAAMLRQTPSVFGNGHSTVRELLQEENQARTQITDTAVPYPQLDSELIDLSGVNQDQVLAKGERLELGRGTMIRTGASIYNIFDQIHESYVDIVNKFAAEFGNGFIVVDMMLEDYLKPATAENYILLETNMTPALALFYGCRDGKHFKVAEDFLAPMIDKVMQESLV